MSVKAQKLRIIMRDSNLNTVREAFNANGDYLPKIGTADSNASTKWSACSTFARAVTNNLTNNSYVDTVVEYSVSVSEELD